MRTALQSGKLMEINLRNALAPSIFAALSISFGMPRINCVRRKMYTAPPPKKLGTMNGQSVSIQPNEK